MLKRLLILMLVLAPSAVSAQAVTDEAQMVKRAANTVERIRTDPRWANTANDVLSKARAVLIVPDLVKGGFIIGAEYGSGVLMTRSPDGSWSSPAFYSIASGSVGFQIGLQDAESMFVIMNDRGLSAIMEDKMKLGAAADVSLLVVGAGAEASTTTHAGADIYAFNTSAGLYAGVTLAGSGILPRPSWNQSYYGAQPSPEDIVITRKYDNPQASHLKDVLAR